MKLFKTPPGLYFNQSNALQSDSSLQSRAIDIINIFRFILSLLFILFYLYVGKSNWLDGDNTSLFLGLAFTYSFYSVGLLLIKPLKPVTFIFFHPVQIVIDIVFIVLAMHVAGGIQSGFGLLLIITIVTASLVSNGRLSLFYAAVATIALLLEQSYQIAKWDQPLSSYTQPVMLSLSCFATAWLAYTLARRMLQSEALASARGVDLKNLSQVNALITQEMQDGVIVVDQDSHIRHHNSQANLLLSLVENSVEPLVLDDSAPQIAAVFAAWLKGEEFRHNLIILVNNRELNLRFKPINHLNRKLGAVIFLQDWSQMQSVAKQAKLAALGRLTANIAHEIRNPLSAISHANQLLQEEENISTANLRMLQIISDNIQRIDQIIKDVLELNRRDRTHQEEIPLNQFLVDFHDQFCAVEKISTEQFQLQPFVEQQVISFDQRHLTQILWNLCKNGWEHSRKTVGSLNLHCVVTGQSGLNLEVIDDGAGVAEQNRGRLFEPFYTTKTTGNGLGLYISRELAEANSAILQYQALALGSAFIIQLKKS